MISLLSLSCVNAEDSDNADIIMESGDESPQIFDTSIPEDSPQAAGAMDDLSKGGDNVSSDNPTSAYLILDNDADKENVYIGDLVVWTVSVINMGPDTAKNVRVFDQLPDGLEYVKHITTKGIFNPKTGIWNIGDLAIADGEVFLNITTKAITAGEKINKANLTTDSINLNNESYEEEEIDVFEHEHNVVKAKTLYSTGNPLVMVIASIFMILAASVVPKK